MVDGADPISAICTALATIQQAITPPEGADKIAYVYDEVVANPNLPCIMNLPTAGQRVTSGASTRELYHEVEILLLLSRGDTKYATRAQRLWWSAIIEAFDQNVRAMDTVQVGMITEWSFEPQVVNGIPYIAVTFKWRGLTGEGYAFSA